ncbi:MAG: BPSL0067 family protein [Methylocella sp.]
MTEWRRHEIKQCVSLVRAVIPELPHSSLWREGVPITPENNGNIPPGTAIATFAAGRYANAASGNHAAIFLVHRPDRAHAPAAGRSGDILRNCQM